MQLQLSGNVFIWGNIQTFGELRGIINLYYSFFSTVESKDVFYCLNWIFFENISLIMNA